MGSLSVRVMRQEYIHPEADVELLSNAHIVCDSLTTGEGNDFEWDTVDNS